MRWRGKRKSSNVEDRRNMRVSGLGGLGRGGGMLRLLPVAFKFLGVKGTVILVVCVGAYGLFSGNLGKYVRRPWFTARLPIRYLHGTASRNCRRKRTG